MIELTKFVKEIAKKEEVCIDNVVFRLHSRATVLILTVCAIIVGVKSYFGEPISCFTNDGDQKIPKDAINSYCWVTNTFTVLQDVPGVEGIDHAGLGITNVGDKATIDQQYYKWVCFVLALQAIFFYAPRALWGVWERNTLNLLSKDLASPIPEESWTDKRRTQLISYFVNINQRSQNFYAIRFSICEIMNLVITVSQIYFINLFLDGEFSLYGPAVMEFMSASKPQNMVSPMTRVFPLKAKCSIFVFGASGTVQNFDAICVLPLNVVNEKLFTFFWFWYIFLSIAGTLAIVYRVLVFTQPWARLYLLRAQTRINSRKKLETLVATLHFGDWFLLNQLAENVSPIVYRELVDELATEVSSKHFEAHA